MERLLIVEDDAGVRTTIVNFLELEGYLVDAVSSSDEALDRLSQTAYPIVISDIYIDGRTGLDVLDAARRKDPTCSVILMTARGTMETVMAATRGGATSRDGAISRPAWSNSLTAASSVAEVAFIASRSSQVGMFQTNSRVWPA